MFVLVTTRVWVPVDRLLAWKMRLFVVAGMGLGATYGTGVPSSSTIDAIEAPVSDEVSPP